MGDKRQSQQDAPEPNRNGDGDNLLDEKQNRNRRLANKKRDRERFDDDFVDIEGSEDDELKDLLDRKKKAGKKKRRKDRNGDDLFVTEDVEDLKDIVRRRKGRRAQIEWQSDDDWDV